MKGQNRYRLVLAWMTVLGTGLGTSVYGGPPLPAHNVEGNSGVFITTTAYLANPPEKGKAIGLPSLSGTFAAMEDKDFESVVVTENLWGRVEMGYALERIGLGDWPAAVQAATGFRVQNNALMHNFNARCMFITEGAGGRSWVPAVTFGAHLKVNQDHKDIDTQLGGTCDALGSDHDTGIELTLVATKTIANWLPRPLIVSAGLRNGDAIHTGLLGFAGERETTFEGSLIYFLSDRLLLASEYRQKSDLCGHVPGLVNKEEDWWDVCLAYIVGDRWTIAGGYADFGSVLDDRNCNVWAIQVKYEF